MTHTKSALPTTHPGAFMISGQDLVFLDFGITMFRFEHSVFSAIFAQVWWTATRIMTILYNGKQAG